MSLSKTKGAFRIGALIGTLGVVMAACGSGSSSATTTTAASTTSTQASSSSAGVQQAQALLSKYTGDPAFDSPGPSIDTSKLAGKTIFSIPANSAVPFVNTVDQVMGTYAKKLGINYVDYTNQQQQAQWVQGINQAISSKANLIDLLAGIPPEQLAPQIEQAKAAGIPTIDTNERDPSQATQAYVAGYVFAPFKLAGELMSAWAVAHTNGKANILVVTSNADISSQAVQNGINQEMSTICPSCKVTAVNVNPVDWATKLQTTVEGSLAGNPNINYILPVFDSMSLFVAPAIVAANKVGQVHIASFNGTPAIIDMIRTGNIVSMDVGENTSNVAAAGLDQAMRIMLGMAPGNEKINVRIIDKSNVSDFGVPAKSGVGYGNAFLTGYAATWNVPVSKLQ